MQIRARWGWLLATVACSVVACLLPGVDGLGGSSAPASGDAAADASSRPFCDTYDGGTDATVCEDMDRPTSLAFGWTVVDAATLTDAAAVSPPRSLDIAYASSQGCQSEYASWLPASANYGGVHVQVDVEMLKTTATGDNAYFLTVEWGGPAQCFAIVGAQTASVGANQSGDYFRLQYLKGGNTELAAGPGPTWAFGKAPEPTVFRRIVFDYDVESKTPPLLTYDGAPATISFSDAGASCSGMKLKAVRFGPHCANSPDFHFRYDNVVITPR